MPYKADCVMVGRAVPKQVRAVSLMIWFLSKSSDLGMAYVLSRGQEYDLGDVDLYSRASVALFMVSWFADGTSRNSDLPMSCCLCLWGCHESDTDGSTT